MAATFNPTNGVADDTNLITLDNTGVTDLAGSSRKRDDGLDLHTVNAKRPSVSLFFVADGDLRARQTSSVTITFNQPSPASPALTSRWRTGR